MQFIDSYKDILNHFPNGNFDIGIWRKYAVEISPELPGKVESDAGNYNFEKDVEPVILAALSKPIKMKMVHDSFISVAKGLEKRFIQLFGIDLELNVILYLGLCNGAGWATMLDNRDVVLLGIEKIIELNWCDKERMRALIFHEIGHVWHKTVGRLQYNTEIQKEKSILQLYKEGVMLAQNA